jgi:hypothetical protein
LAETGDIQLPQNIEGSLKIIDWGDPTKAL